MFKKRGAYLTWFILSIIIFPSINSIQAASTHIESSHQEITQHPGSEYSEGELLVKFKPGTTDEQKASVHRKLGSTVLKVFKSIGVEHIRLRDGLSVKEAIRLYREDPHIEYAEPNYKAGIQGGTK